MTVKQAIESSDIMHWADKAAERVIQTKGNRKAYTVAAGITPSGTVHIVLAEDSYFVMGDNRQFS